MAAILLQPQCVDMGIGNVGECSDINALRHTEVETKWPPFCDDILKLTFSGWKLLDSDSNFTETFSQETSQ